MRRVASRFVSLLVFSLTLAIPLSSFGEDLSVVRVTPSGEDVEPGKEIVIEFNKPMTVLGTDASEIKNVPVTIDPPLPCFWKWISPTTLSCALPANNALTPSKRFVVAVNSGWKALDGAILKEEFRASILTRRATVRHSDYRTPLWQGAGSPDVQISTDQSVTSESLSLHLFFLLDSGERLEVGVKERPTSDHKLWDITPLKGPLPEGVGASLRVEPGVTSEEGPELGNQTEVLWKFSTFPPLTFQGIECRWENQDGEQRCNPLFPASLRFSAPVSSKVLFDATTKTPSWWGAKKKGEHAEVDETESEVEGEEASSDEGENGAFFIEAGIFDRRDQDPHKSYLVPLPPFYKANQEFSISLLAGKLQDRFSRPLGKDETITIKTATRDSEFVLPNEIAVLESGIDSELPIYGTNISSFEFNYRAVTSQGELHNQSCSFSGPLVPDLSVKMPFPIRQLLKNGSGIVTGEVTATPTKLGRESTRIRGTNNLFAEVTPFEVHLKLGYNNSSVWVTRFATGEPVEGATVRFLTGGLFSGSFSPNQAWKNATTDTHGIAELQGVKDIDPQLTYVETWEREASRLIVEVKRGDEVAYLPVHYDLEENVAGVWPDLKKRYGHVKAWGATAQGIYKLGDTIEAKVWVRDQGNSGLIPPPKLSYTIEVKDPLDKSIATFEHVSLSEFGAWSSDVAIPKEGAVGWYRFEISSPDLPETLEAFRVLVSDFTPASFHVKNELQGELFKTGNTAKVDTLATLHAGGPYANASVKLTGVIHSSRIQVKDPTLNGFAFSSLYGEDDEISKASESQIFEEEKTLSEKGELLSSVTIPETQILYGDLQVESAVQDDRGKFVAAHTSKPFRGRDRYVGVAIDSWIFTTGQPTEIKMAVINEHEKLVKGVPITLTVKRDVIHAARVKGPGNAFLTKYTHRWETESVPTCKHLRSAEGPISCFFTPKSGGTYRVIVHIADTEGRPHETQISRWGIGSEFQIWDTGTSNRLQMQVDKDAYSVGDTAKVALQNPYPGAQALLSIERYGIIKQWTQKLEKSTEVIEIPITEDLTPGCFFSAVVFSPRVAKPIKGEVDLGKPAFRMGYTTLNVKERAKEIVITSSVDKEVYRPREKVQLSLNAKMHSTNNEPIEFAVAVLDEAVFDLLFRGKDQYDPYGGFYELGSLGVRNYDLLKVLIGRIKFEKKGAATAGDGGGSLSMRTLFKYVAYWNPSVRADKDGNATLDFTLPDSLTGWRVLAMGTTPTDKMGLGVSSFKVNQPTEIRSALPNQIIDGDDVDATFTVMNRTDKTRTLSVTASANGAVEGSPQITTSIEAKPFARVPVSLHVKGKGTGTIHFSIKAGDSQDSDALAATLPVGARSRLEFVAFYGSTTEAKVVQPCAIPASQSDDTGVIGVAMSPSVITGIDGAFKYLRDYPYACWEQKLTKALMAAYVLKLRSYLPASFIWDGAEKLPQATLDLAASYQTPDGGMAYYEPTQEHTDPHLSVFTALGFIWMEELGYKPSTVVQDRLDEYLVGLLRNQSFPSYYSPDGIASTRALIFGTLALRHKISLDEYMRMKERLATTTLFSRAILARGLAALHAPQEEIKALIGQIVSAAHETGGGITFNDSLSPEYSWLLESRERTTCGVLSTLLQKEISALVPRAYPEKIVRSISEMRKTRDRWESTQDNLFCMKALIDYAARYEKDKPAMKLTASVGDKTFGEAHFTSVRQEPIRFDQNISELSHPRSGEVKITKEGTGRVYYTTLLGLKFKDLPQTPRNDGIEVSRTYEVSRGGAWEPLSNALTLKKGELVRVSLTVTTPAPKNFIVVDDPLPGALEPVNSELATASRIGVSADEDHQSYGVFYHRELRNDFVRFYSEYVPQGTYHLSYVAQAIAPGSFVALPTHAEMMYQPDVRGDGVPAYFTVQSE